jgi:hypothetical protein
MAARIHATAGGAIVSLTAIHDPRPLHVGDYISFISK